MEKETTVHDVELGWVADVIKESSNILGHNSKKTQQRPTIFRMPPTMRSMGSDLKDDLQAMEPKLVCIGPYHHDKSHPIIKELKRRLLYNYYPKVQNLYLLEKKIEDFEQQARDCYSEAIDSNNLNSKEFRKMLLIDGVFLAELLDGAFMKVHEFKRMISDNMWFEDLLYQDLLLIENQLPFFIVEHLLRAKGVCDIIGLKKKALVFFFNRFLPQPYKSLGDLSNKFFEEGVDHLHLLHLFHMFILNIPEKKDSNTTGYINLSLKLLYSPLSFIINRIGDCLSQVSACCCEASKQQEFIPSTTELADAGVKIKVKEANSFLHISFCKKRGELEIPSIRVFDNTYVILRNLVAWEQCYHVGEKRQHVCENCHHVSEHDYGMDITHYVLFIDHIIDTPKDVGLLYQNRIINRGLGNNDNIASVYNKLSTGVTIDFKKGYLKDVCKDVNSYCQLTWPMWRAKLVRDYFSNPWAVISLLAAVILLGLTVLQTVYSILSYY